MGIRISNVMEMTNNVTETGSVKGISISPREKLYDSNGNTCIPANGRAIIPIRSPIPAITQDYARKGESQCTSPVLKCGIVT